MVVAGDDVGAELRVEGAYFLDGDVEHLGNLCEVDAPVDADGVGDERLAGQRRADVVLLVVGHRIVGGDEGGHIAAGLAGQVLIDVPEVALVAIAVQGLVDVAGAAVIGGDGQRPVVVDLVEVLEVLGGHGAGAVGVAALVDERVHLESQALAGADHELPQSGGSHA